MDRIIDEKREALKRLCTQYGVARLSVFGSAATEGFRPETSDVDFLVEFLELPSGHHADRYFGLLEDLEALFGRRVDLVMRSAVRNPYFLQAVEESKVVLYAA